MWQESQAVIDEIRQSRQFGSGPWPWTGMTRLDDDNARDATGSMYHLNIVPINNAWGWSLAYMYNENHIVEGIVAPLRRTMGLSIGGVCLLFGIVVWILFRQVSRNIEQRRAAESLIRKKR